MNKIILCFIRFACIYICTHCNVTAINGGSLQAQFHCAKQRLVQRTTTDDIWVDRFNFLRIWSVIEICARARAILESTMVKYIGAQQRGSCNWRTAGAALNFRASILHIVILEISIYITISALTLKLSRILLERLNKKK